MQISAESYKIIGYEACEASDHNIYIGPGVPHTPMPDSPVRQVDFGKSFFYMIYNLFIENMAIKMVDTSSPKH